MLDLTLQESLILLYNHVGVVLMHVIDSDYITSVCNKFSPSAVVKALNKLQAFTIECFANILRVS